MNAYRIKDFTDELKKKGYSITRNQLRHYEREGLVTPERVKRGQSEYRYYLESDLNRVIIITNLISLSWTSKEVSALLKLASEMDNIVNKMIRTKKLLLESIDDKKIDNPEIIQEIDSWKNYKADFSNKVLPGVINSYSGIQLDKGIIERDTLKMLEKTKFCADILEKYYNRIKQDEDEIMKLTGEIVDLANKVANKIGR